MTSRDIARFIGKKIWLRKLGFCFIRLTTLREWYIFRTLQRILKERGSDMAVLDAGFGMGQHTYHLARSAQISHIVAVEQDDELVNDFRHFLHHLNKHQVRLMSGDMQNLEVEGPFDLILCCSVMEHIENDVALLSKFHALLHDDGCLLLYMPTSERRVLKHLQKKIAAMTAQSGGNMPHGHVRYDQPVEVVLKLEKAGFAVKVKEISYGPYGRLAYDVVTSVQFSPLFKVLFPFYLLFVHPFILLLMLMDLHRDNREGNGLLLVAAKSSAKIK